MTRIHKNSEFVNSKYLLGKLLFLLLAFSLGRSKLPLVVTNKLQVLRAAKNFLPRQVSVNFLTLVLTKNEKLILVFLELIFAVLWAGASIEGFRSTSM